MKIKFITTTKSQAQQGFGLLETTAAAMLSLLFVSMGANLVLTANIYKIKAKRNDVMNSLIRADIESIKYQSTKQNDLSKCTTDPQNGFAKELKGKIGTDLAESMPPAGETPAQEAVRIAAENTKTATIKILGRNYILKRKADSIIDPDILPISYTFAAEAPPDKTQAEMPLEYNITIKIIPNASFNCPTPIVL